MKETVEEAKQRYIDNHVSGNEYASFGAAFEAGAEWQAKQSPWISVEERLPEDNELVLTSSSIYGTKLLVWNDFHKVWDDEDGDDVYCDLDKIDAWMPIPE